MDILIPLGEYLEDIPGNKMDFYIFIPIMISIKIIYEHIVG